MIALTKIRELDLSQASSPSRPRYLSAASGLVCVKSVIYIVADDELHLAVFGAADHEPGRLVRLFEGELPDSAPKRKKHKPDFEALTMLPAYGDFPHGALLALGSGSRPNRRMGAVLELGRDGHVEGAAQAVDLSFILTPLADMFSAPNIEGAVVSGSELRLFQRGNKRDAENAIIRFQLSTVIEALRSGRASAIKPSSIVKFDLGEIDGIPFCFTDAAALPDGSMVFTAVAEDTDNAYDDGDCTGAAVGCIDGESLRWLRRLDRPYKVEGVAARIEGDAIKLLLVTDADDISIPASLFSATIEAR